MLSHYGADGALTRTLAWNLQYEHTDDRVGKSGLECWLAGFKGDLGPHESIVLMLGRPELRVDGTTVPGQTFKMTFTCKLDEADSVALNGEVTNWSRKTKATPSTVTGRLPAGRQQGVLGAGGCEGGDEERAGTKRGRGDPAPTRFGLARASRSS